MGDAPQMEDHSTSATSTDSAVRLRDFPKTIGSRTFPTYSCTVAGRKNARSLGHRVSSSSTIMIGIGSNIATIDPTLGMKLNMKVSKPQMNQSLTESRARMIPTATPVRAESFVLSRT